MTVHCDFEKIIKIENIFRAWRVFKAGKTAKSDVAIFERNLEDNLFALELELKSETYNHSKYKYFTVSDPKKRDIHKAQVRDRIVYQMLYDYLTEIFETDFIDNSYSSRIGKGTHKAVQKVKEFSESISKKNFGQCYAMKCDVRKYFENIDHRILFEILCRKIKDQCIRRLLQEVINSFHVNPEKGVPLGNVTSQIFANIYLNELDQYVLKKLKVRYYIRYNDDFIFLGSNRKHLCEIAEKSVNFVRNKLLLEIPKEKMVFRKLKWGIDFCGSVVLPNAMFLRQKTKKRMIGNIAKVSQEYTAGKISEKEFTCIVNSYFGLLKHCDSYNLKNKIKNKFIYERVMETTL